MLLIIYAGYAGGGWNVIIAKGSARGGGGRLKPLTSGLRIIGGTGKIKHKNY
jgi:hypothetical protein